MNLKFVGLLAWYYGFRTIIRGPSYIIASLSAPLTLLFIIYLISSGQLLPYAIIGGFIGLVASVALSSSGDAAFFRLQLRIQDLFVASSITPVDYILGLTTSYLVFSFPGIILYVILGMYYHMFTLISALALALILVNLVMSTSAISFIIASSIGHIRNVWGIAGILSVVMTVLPPTFYPYTLLPPVAIYALAISPATPAAILAQGVFHLAPFHIGMAYFMVAQTFVYYAMARYLTRWRQH